MTTKTRTDFQAIRTVTTLANFAPRFPAWPYVWFHGRYFAPLFYGGGESPAYRVSSGPTDKGPIVLTWPDGRRFRSQRDRDSAALVEAARLAPDDPTAAEARAILTTGGRGRPKTKVEPGATAPDTSAGHSGERSAYPEGTTEPPRESWRLQSLRGWSHGDLPPSNESS